MKKSWKTTLSGLVTSGAALAMAVSAAGVRLPHVLVVIAGFVLAGGFASLGIAGKDASVHSTAEEVRAATIEEKVSDQPTAGGRYLH